MKSNLVLIHGFDSMFLLHSKLYSAHRPFIEHFVSGAGNLPDLFIIKLL